jgi:cell wall-associated NlpC family hydrolase
MMAGKATRLRFTEDELENPKLRRAAEKADRAADRADRAAEKIRKKRRPKLNMDQRSQRKVRLTFENETAPAHEIAGGGNRFRRTSEFVSGAVHGKVAAENQDDNAAVEAVNTGTGMAEGGVHAVEHASYSKKLKSYDKAEKLMDKSDSANVEALYQQRMAENPEQFSNPISRWQQKRAIRREYAAARRAEEHTAAAGSAAGKSTQTVRGIGRKLSELKDHAFEYAAEHPHVILLAGGMALLLLLVCSSMTSCSTFLPGGSGTVVATTFTARDEDIIGANDDYKAMEADLSKQIDRIKSDYPGYDEYNFNLDEIGHDPYQLTAYLTVFFEDYTRDEVQAALKRLFDQQYDLELVPETEIRTRTETRTGHHTVHNPDGTTDREEYTYEVEVEYEYHILNVTLRNKNLGHIITESGGMSGDQAERYAVLLETKGNKAYLFADDPSVATPDAYLDYDIPGEALTDTKFSNMIHEAEKYLGYPYVWGGSSPSTSFDCSGFVSYVINHCGNGWNVGRQTAEGLRNSCSIIPASAARPGDLIFFQGTYETAGASHVGIYVGNNMMIHCGNPIQYASIDTPYWRQHFYCFGRLPN